MRGSWFQLLFGFSEGSRSDVQSKLVHAKELLMSKANNKSWAVGPFETPTLSELRERVAKLPKSGNNKRLKFVHSYGDVQTYLAHPDNQLATFQVASQFNCLEFVGPSVTPEDGITGYAGDRTQGPACSIACGPATAVRNYLIPVQYMKGKKVATQLGQTEQHQIDNLSDFNKVIGNENGVYFKVRNGYTLGVDEGLAALDKKLELMTPAQLDQLRGSLRVGVHSDVQVTATDWGRELLEHPQIVSQVFSSACSVAYSHNHRYAWTRVATLILEATYEATLLSTILNAHRHGHQKGSKKVYLTAVGGGVFGNSFTWISQAIERACTQCFHHDLEVHLITYGRSQLHPSLEKLPSYFPGVVAGAVAPATVPETDGEHKEEGKQFVEASATELSYSSSTSSSDVSSESCSSSMPLSALSSATSTSSPCSASSISASVSENFTSSSTSVTSCVSVAGSKLEDDGVFQAVETVQFSQLSLQEF